MSRADPWTPDHIELLRVGAAARLSAAEIARTLPVKFTRNAIIGKMRRLSIKAGQPPKRYGVSVKQASARKRSVVAALRQGLPAPAAHPACPPADPEPPVAAAAPAPLAPADRQTIFGLLQSMCRFPLFEGAEPVEQRFYCGAPTSETGGSWCEHCAKIVFAPTKKFTRTA